MQLTKQPVGKKFLIAIVSFVVNTIVATLLFVGHNEVIVKNSDAVLKEGKTYLPNSFDTLLALSLVFLIPAYLLYYLLSYFLKLRSKSLAVQILTGIVATLIPILVLYLNTYGINLANPFIQTEFIVMIISGILMPILDNRLLK